MAGLIVSVTQPSFADIPVVTSQFGRDDVACRHGARIRATSVPLRSGYTARAWRALTPGVEQCGAAGRPPEIEEIAMAFPDEGLEVAITRLERAVSDLSKRVEELKQRKKQYKLMEVTDGKATIDRLNTWANGAGWIVVAVISSVDGHESLLLELDATSTT